MAQVLPDTGTVQFLATTADTRGGEKEGTVYGAGHITAYVAADKEFIIACYLDGKIALIDPPPVYQEPVIPRDYPPPG